MKTDNLCGYCVHFPLCYEVWRVDAAHPCKHISGGSVGFFRPKGELAALKEENERLWELIEAYRQKREVDGLNSRTWDAKSHLQAEDRIVVLEATLEGVVDNG